MTLSRFVASQLGNPSGVFAGLAGFVWNRRNAALNDTVLGLLALKPDDRVLEIGFGGGYLLRRMLDRLPAGSLAGVDISPGMLAHAEKRFGDAIRAGRVELKCAAAEALPYADAHFTKVVSVNSIFYWQDIERALGEITRVLIPGGRLVLCFTSAASLVKKGFARGIHLYEAQDVEQLLARHGFREIAAISPSDRHRRYHCVSAQNGAGHDYPS
jgi:ubiquinone/menaquinone biosynthesis C-methylase UbiE